MSLKTILNKQSFTGSFRQSAASAGASTSLPDEDRRLPFFHGLTLLL